MQLLLSGESLQYIATDRDGSVHSSKYQDYSCNHAMWKSTDDADHARLDWTKVYVPRLNYILGELLNKRKRPVLWYHTWMFVCMHVTNWSRKLPICAQCDYKTVTKHEKQGGNKLCCWPLTGNLHIMIHMMMQPNEKPCDLHLVMMWEGLFVFNIKSLALFKFGYGSFCRCKKFKIHMFIPINENPNQCDVFENLLF